MPLDREAPAALVRSPGAGSGVAPKSRLRRYSSSGIDQSGGCSSSSVRSTVSAPEDRSVASSTAAPARTPMGSIPAATAARMSQVESPTYHVVGRIHRQLVGGQEQEVRGRLRVRHAAPVHDARPLRQVERRDRGGHLLGARGRRDRPRDPGALDPLQCPAHAGKRSGARLCSSNRSPASDRGARPPRSPGVDPRRGRPRAPTRGHPCRSSAPAASPRPRCRRRRMSRARPRSARARCRRASRPGRRSRRRAGWRAPRHASGHPVVASAILPAIVPIDPTTLDPDPIRQLGAWIADAEAAGFRCRPPSRWPPPTATGFRPSGSFCSTASATRACATTPTAAAARAAMSRPTHGVRRHSGGRRSTDRPGSRVRSGSCRMTRPCPTGAPGRAAASCRPPRPTQTREIGSRAELEAAVAELSRAPSGRGAAASILGRLRADPAGVEFWESRERPPARPRRIPPRRGRLLAR